MKDYKEKIIETVKELEIDFDEILYTESYYCNTWENNPVLIIITNEKPMPPYKKVIEKLEQKGIPTIFDGYIELPYGGKGEKYILIPQNKIIKKGELK